MIMYSFCPLKSRLCLVNVIKTIFLNFFFEKINRLCNLYVVNIAFIIRSHMIVTCLVHNVFKHHIQMIFLGRSMRSSNVDMIPASKGRRRNVKIILFNRKLYIKIITQSLFILSKKTALQCTSILVYVELKNVEYFEEGHFLTRSIL